MIRNMLGVWFHVCFEVQRSLVVSALSFGDGYYIGCYGSYYVDSYGSFMRGFCGQ